MEEKIAELIGSLNLDERNILKNALSRNIDEFFDNNNHLVNEDLEKLSKFNLLASTLRKLVPNWEKIPENGIAYYGKPSWLDSNLLNELIAEAEQRRLEPLDRIDHFLGCGGYFADQLSESKELLDFVKQMVGPASKTGIASYIYYDVPGSGIKPHVDTDVFSINLILMLKHSYSPGTTPSATIVFPAFRAPEYYRLQVGEVMIMYGSSTIHTRSLIQENEIVHLLTIGFNPTVNGV